MQHPEAIKELQPLWPRAFPGRSAWEQMVKGLIEFGCSGQEAIRRRRKWRRGWTGCHLVTRELGALARNSGNPPPTVTNLEELRQGPGWVAQGCKPPHCPQHLSPKFLLLRGWGEIISVWGAGATGWFLSPGIFISKGSTATTVDGDISREAGCLQRPVSLRSRPQELCASEP